MKKLKRYKKKFVEKSYKKEYADLISFLRDNGFTVFPGDNRRKDILAKGVNINYFKLRELIISGGFSTNWELDELRGNAWKIHLPEKFRESKYPRLKRNEVLCDLCRNYNPGMSGVNDYYYRSCYYNPDLGKDFVQDVMDGNFKECPKFEEL